MPVSCGLPPRRSFLEAWHQMSSFTRTTNDAIRLNASSLLREGNVMTINHTNLRGLFTESNEIDEQQLRDMATAAGSIVSQGPSFNSGRRRFGRLVLGFGAATVSACGVPKNDILEIGEHCAKGPEADDILRIDMHCHLLNQKDVDAVAFLVRRELNLDEENRFLNLPAGLIARLHLEFLNLSTKTAVAETQSLRKAMANNRKKFKKGRGSTSKWFCDHANEEQDGIFLTETFKDNSKAYGNGRPTGFGSNRARNAALMMAQFPLIDIFMPSMIDFHEGENYPVTPLHEQVGFYKELNIATHGRFLPLVAFNPGRQVAAEIARERNSGPMSELTPLELAEKAIREEGFIGVKVHPSGGFNPVRNEEFACENAGLQGGDGRLGSEIAGRYDRAMEQIFELCEEYDVPVLTHASDGLAANEQCMKRNDNPSNWTNAPNLWVEALGTHKYLRVCLAHLASRFHNQIHMRDGKYKGDVAPVEYKNGALAPSDWLTDALGALEASEGNRLFLDLSYMVDLTYSQATKSKYSDGTNWFRRFAGGVSDTLTDEYADAFRTFLEAHSEKLARQAMYGTDWHMPGVSIVGSKDQYQRLIEGLLPAGEYRKRVMGGNAADFFGLKSGCPTRQRLEIFYRAHGVTDLRTIHWMERLDSQA